MALTSLFKKPAWQHRKAERRREAVAHLRDSALTDALPEIAQNDADVNVRLAAIDRLGDFYLDMRFAYEADEPAIRSHCLARYRAALLGNDPSAQQRLNDAERDKLIARLTDRELLNDIRKQAVSSGSRRAALDTLEQVSAFADTAVHDRDAQLRRYAAGRIEDEATLRDVAERLRKHDKHLHQQLQERLTDLAIARGDHSAVAERATALCQQMEQLMLHTRQATPQHFDHLEQQWTGIEAAAGETLQSRFQRARQVVGIACGRLQAPAPVPASEPARSASEASATETTTDAGQSQDQAAIEPEPTVEPDAELGELIVQVRQQADQVDALNDQTLADWKNRQAEFQDRLGNSPENTAPLQALAGAIRAIEKARHQQHAKAQQGKISAQLDALEAALEDKQLPPAAQAEKAILELSADGGQWPGALSKRWREARKNLGELRSWQRWADNQVRETLCEQAEALLSDRPHPDALVEKLRQLREQWQQLDAKEAATEASGRPSGGALRRRFHQATRAAHDIAKPFFEKRDSVRGEHTDQLAQRADQLDALKAQLPEVDWKQVEQALRDGRAALRDLPNALPKARKTLAERLRQAIAPLSEALDDHQQRVERIKQGLLEQAKALAEQTGPGANKQAGELMQQWKLAGSAGRRREQKLWKPFRAALDAVHSNQQAEREASQQQRQQAQTQLQQALDALATALDSAEKTLEDVPGEVQQTASEAWQAHGDMATSQQKTQREHLNTAISAHRQARKQAEAKREQALLWQASEQLHALEVKRTAGEEVSIPESLPDELQLRAKALELTPEELIEKGEKLESKASELTLLMEIVAELPSPPEQEQARMNMQVARLNQRLGGDGDNDDLSSLLKRWHSLGPVSDQAWKALRPRVAAVERMLQA